LILLTAINRVYHQLFHGGRPASFIALTILNYTPVNHSGVQCVSRAMLTKTIGSLATWVAL